MTFGEVISTALINTLLGMGTVFAMLILISFVIYLFKFIPKEPAAERKAKAAREKAAQAETGRAGGASMSSAPEDGDSDAGRMDPMQEEMEQGELVAVIMAAIMAEQQKEQADIAAGGVPAGQVPADGQPWPYVVRSIRRRR